MTTSQYAAVVKVRPEAAAPGLRNGPTYWHLSTPRDSNCIITEAIASAITFAHWYDLLPAGTRLEVIDDNGSKAYRVAHATTPNPCATVKVWGTPLDALAAYLSK